MAFQIILQKLLQQAIPESELSLIVTSPVPKNQSGDLALSFFDLAKETKSNPKEYAEKIAKILSEDDRVKETNLAGPYLNVTLESAFFFEEVFGSAENFREKNPKKIMVEYSSPNTNKPLHLGHMRNHALGISLANVLESAGHKITRVRIVNDRGVHICKSMLAYEQFGDGDTPEKSKEKSDHFVGKYYVRYETEFKKNPDLAKQIQQMLLDWEAGDKKTKNLWQKMHQWAIQGMNETYARQGVVFDAEYYESDTYLQGKEIAKKGLDDGVFQKRKDGAITIDLTDEGLDEKVILRADETSVYLTQDLSSTSIKQEKYQPDEQIWVVADEQNYHFQLLFRCLEKLKIINVENCHHLSYGLVNLPDGRMKSREGNVVDADNLMDELRDIAMQKIRENNPDMPDTKRAKIAEQIQNAAWKFYLLKTSPRKTITFEAEKSIDFQGATGPYVQYSGVRIHSILSKAQQEGFEIPDNVEIFAKILDDDEKPLGRKIMEYTDELQKAVHHYNTTYIVTYLLELAQEWSRFYAEHQVIDENNREKSTARLALAKKVFTLIESGLGILGIEIPEKM